MSSRHKESKECASPQANSGHQNTTGTTPPTTMSVCQASTLKSPSPAKSTSEKSPSEGGTTKNESAMQGHDEQPIIKSYAAISTSPSLTSIELSNLSGHVDIRECEWLRQDYISTAALNRQMSGRSAILEDERDDRPDEGSSQSELLNDEIQRITRNPGDSELLACIGAVFSHAAEVCDIFGSQETTIELF